MDYTIQLEKIQQAVGILQEKNIDAWLTFVRETEHNADPALPLICPVNVTWHTALLITNIPWPADGSEPREALAARLQVPVGTILEVELLKRYRMGERDPRVKEGIHLSINAIATALRNSG